MLDAITGEFRDAQLEARYLSEAAPALHRRSLVAASAVLLVWGGMALADPFAAGTYTPTITVLRLAAAGFALWALRWGRRGEVRRQRIASALIVLSFSFAWLGIASVNQIEDNGRLLQVALYVFGLGLISVLTTRTLVLLCLGVAVPHYAFHVAVGGSHAPLAGLWLVGVSAFALGFHRLVGNTERRSHLAQWRLEEAVTAREHLVAAMGHELRGPLSTMLAITELLGKDLPKEDQALWLKRMEERIGSLNDSLLAVMRLGSLGSMQPIEHAEELRTSQMWTEVAKELAGVRPTCELVIEESDALLLGDQELLRAALRNLLANGLRYATTRVHVRTIVDDDACRFVVDDDGPGVAPEQVETIFEPAIRSSRGRRADTKGVGLGLAVTRRVARAHGGEVTVASSPLGGARFVLRVPAVSMRTEASRSFGSEATIDPGLATRPSHQEHGPMRKDTCQTGW